jgi:hypothetical protein
MRASRQIYRRRRELHRALEAAPIEHRSELDYDALEIMESIDNMPTEYRALVNEHGFTPVVKALRETTELDRVKRILAERHRSRQQQLAEGIW